MIIAGGLHEALVPSFAPNPRQVLDRYWIISSSAEPLKAYAQLTRQHYWQLFTLVTFGSKGHRDHHLHQQPAVGKSPRAPGQAHTLPQALRSSSFCAATPAAAAYLHSCLLVSAPWYRDAHPSTTPSRNTLWSSRSKAGQAHRQAYTA